MSDIEKNNVEDDINLILESIISGEELDNSDNLLETINNSNQNFSNINMQLENIIDKYSSVGNIAFGYIANALKSSAADHILGIAEDIYDTNLKKYQSEINSSILSSSDVSNTYLPLAGGEMTGDIKSTNIYPTITNSYTLGRTQRVQYKNVYSKEFTEDGVSLTTKYAPKTHEHDNVYKPLQTPVADPTNDTGAAITFIGSITQDKNGVISAAKKTVPTMIGATASNDGSIGLVPAPGSGQQSLFLKGDGTWSEIPIYTGANATNSTIGTPGLVPRCTPVRAEAFLRGDGVWTQPRTMTGATSSTTGISGFVPAPSTRDYASFLRGDGTWREIPIYTGANMATTTNGIPGLVPECPAGRAEAFLRGDGHWIMPANATTSTAGFMSSADKTKLDGIEEGANNYSLPIASSSILGGIKVGSGLGITSSGTLSHSTSAGYKHIPSGGSANQYLKYSSSGTAVWANPEYQFYNYGNLYTGGATSNNPKLPTSLQLSGDVKFVDGGRLIIKFINNHNKELEKEEGFPGLTTIVFPDGTSMSLTYGAMTSTGYQKTHMGDHYLDIIMDDSSGTEYGYLTGYLALNADYAANAAGVNISTSSASSSYPLVFTNNVTAGNKSLYTDSVNSLHYNPSTDILTASCISVKTTGVAAEGIRLTGGTATTAPSISIKTAGSLVEGIRLTGRGTSNNTYTAAEIKVAGGPTGTHTTITGGSSPVTSSDERLKNFKNDVEVDFDKLKQIPKKYFTWKDGDQTKLEMGTSAQEVEKLYPNIVQEIDGYKSLEYSKLSIIALAAIDKLNERITELENKLKEYEQA